MRRNGAEGLSLVAGIRDRNGCLRIVITDSRDNLRPHICDGERAFVLPDLLVREPLTIEQFAEMRIERQVREYIAQCEREEREPRKPKRRVRF